LVETQQWQEAKGILNRYEKVSRISPQSLSMAMKIERGTGNDTAADGYLNMLLKMFPIDPITKSILIDQQSTSQIVSKTDLPAVLIKAATTSAALVESQPIDNTVTVTVTEKNESLTRVKETNIDTNDAVQASVAIAKKLPDNKIATGNTVTVIEKNDTLANVKGVNIEMDDDVKAGVEVAEKLPQQITKVESEILDEPDFHVVAEGENLYRISLLYNIKMQRLIDWNDLADASAIYEGKKLSLVAPSVVE
jgi:type IV pilus assembly protein PilF